jgi:hypothetical protein
LAQLKKYEDAVADCKSALEIDPDYVKARLKVGNGSGPIVALTRSPPFFYLSALKNFSFRLLFTISMVNFS